MAFVIIVRTLSIVFLLLKLVKSSHNEEDFAFELDDDNKLKVVAKIIPLQRLYGIPDSSSYVGRLFQFKIPSDAFSGTLSHYEVSGMPDWMMYDFENGQGVFRGVPGDKDVGESYISVTAVGPKSDDKVKDVFAVEVSPDPREFSSDIKEPRCKPGQDATTLTVVLDQDFNNIAAIDRISSMKNIAGFLALDDDKFSLLPQTGDDDLLSETVIMAGPGNRKKKIAKSSTILQWQVGCGGSVWSNSNVISRIRQIAKDGTLAEVLQLPVLGWHLATNPFPFRERREVVGSGEGENENENENETDNEEILEPEPDKRVVFPVVSPSPTPVMPEQSATIESHRVRHHNHHHHERIDLLAPSSSVLQQLASLTNLPGPVSIMPTPTMSPERPTQSVIVENHESEHVSSSPVVVPEVPRVDSTAIHENASLTTDLTVEPELVDKEAISVLETSTEHLSSIPYTEVTQSKTPTLPQRVTTLEPVTTEGIDKAKEIEETKNKFPVIVQRLPKMYVTAGKILRFKIPDETFNDDEDGPTSRLHVAIKTKEGTPISPYSWMQFNSETLEIYCLPLEEHVSKWTFIIEATDSEGDFVSDDFEIIVQHHKGQRTVTHEITLHLQPSDHSPIQGLLPLNDQILIVNRLASIYKNPDESQITTVGVNASSFSWTNDSLVRTQCPLNEINSLVKTLAEDDGRPRQSIKAIFLPEIDVVKVTWLGKGQCEGTHKVPDLPPKTTNFAPVPRNQVDRLNATVGELLVYSVPEDSFYDPEDGNVRNLKLRLLDKDSNPIHPSHWLQFDGKNQEFYGIPNSTGRSQYQLVVEDSGGLTFIDGLVVDVNSASKILYNVEFSMTLSIPYEMFITSPSSKRSFVEKVASLFGDKDTSAIVISGYSPGSTVITWHNRSLPVDDCPNTQIKVLRQILLGDDERVSVRAETVMGPEFTVLSASLTPIGLCEGALTPIYVPEASPLPPDEIRPVSHSEEYLITIVVPAVVISTMLVCAGFVACVLYRRRRTGKMSVGDEDERQSFRNKGIPVIFQDELEERPEPTNKSPIIMKEEKPPLPPPEYQRSHPSPATALLSDTEDSPYQPPPPFTSSRDSTRPKPTPTYRMPPPYVPP